MQWHRQIIDDTAGRAARIVAQRRLTAPTLHPTRMVRDIVAQTGLPEATVWLVVDAQHNYFVDVGIDDGAKHQLNLDVPCAPVTP